MKTLCSLALLAVASASLPGSPSFSEFMAAYGKSYSGRMETALRAKIYEANLKRIEAHNAKNLTYWLGVNQFADLTGDEWRAAVASGKKSTKGAVAPGPSPFKGVNLPSTVNWTAAGGVTPVKDQGQCGSCWAFATVVAVEGANFITHKTLVSYSEQQIVSCDKADGNDGCNGGDQLPAMQWLAQQPGLCTEAGYPYTSGGGNTGTCKKTCTPAIKITSGIEVQAENQTALEAAIAAMPISLSVDASDDAIWQSYVGGVVTGHCSNCKNPGCLDHGVGGAGYGTDPQNGDYWLVKNSWGADWGERGYIRLARGANYNPYGQCGLQIDNQYVTVA